MQLSQVCPGLLQIRVFYGKLARHMLQMMLELLPQRLFHFSNHKRIRRPGIQRLKRAIIQRNPPAQRAVVAILRQNIMRRIRLFLPLCARLRMLAHAHAAIEMPEQLLGHALHQFIQRMHKFVHRHHAHSPPFRPHYSIFSRFCISLPFFPLPYANFHDIIIMTDYYHPGASMAEIIVSGIEKSFEQDRIVLDGVSFQVDAGERVGLLGGNGAGKTTLLRIITGELSADKGTISIPQGRRIGYISQLAEVPQGALVEDVLRMAFSDIQRISGELEALQQRMDAGELSDALLRRYDQLRVQFEMLGGYDCEMRLGKVANGLHISQEQRRQPFSSLSGGEQTRIRLAVMILRESDILLLDEPTNHLDMQSIEWLEDYIDHYKGTVLTVSHDRYFLDRTVTRIIELEHGGVEFYSGNYSFYVTEKEARYRQQLRQYEKEQAKIAQLEKAAEQLSSWAYSGMDKTYKRVVSIRRRIEWLRQTEKPTREERLDMGFSLTPFRADYALRIRDLKKSYGARTLFEGATLTIRGGGERVALVGANGAGKTTLLKILLGEETPDDGIVQFGPSVRAAYLPQQIEFAHPERTLYDTLLYELGLEPQQARNRLGAYRFRGEDQFKRVEQLSGGERARLKLCMLMNSAVNMLILDEPTNHLDLDSREWIESAVDQFEGTLLIVSHDRYFVRRFANRIWELSDGRLRDFDCGYEKYRFIREREEEAAQAQSAQLRAIQREAEKAEKAEKAAQRPGRRDAKTERRMNVVERDIARLEQQCEALEQQIEENASDYVRLSEIESEKAALQQQIDTLYAEWERLDQELHG